jgi:hypothetical protein
MLIKQNQLPEKNNFCALFRGISKSELKRSMEKYGWKSRNSGWTEFELTNDWSELNLEGDDPELLLDGVVVFNQITLEALDSFFNMLGCNFVYEFYDENDKLLLEKRNEQLT